MSLISNTKELESFCRRIESSPYITVDLEFMREKTFFSKLCLIQVANKNEAVCIDALASNIDLSSLFDIMKNPNIVKVFHSARQDIEIFFYLMKEIPSPIFDTQIAAMVCGFSDSISYQKLVFAVTGKNIDKGMRFSDWSKRPLSENQLKYALADVTYLRNIYEQIKEEVEKNNRTSWLDEEMAIITNPKTYLINPEKAWLKIKTSSTSPKQLAVLKELAKWREVKAIEIDKPRRHILKDEQLLEISAAQPTSLSELKSLRGIPNGIADGKFGSDIVDAVKKGLSYNEKDMPQPEPFHKKDKSLEQITELLMMLLSIKCGMHNVATKMIAVKNDIELIAENDSADVPALKGWRRELFGKDALLLKKGKILIGYDASKKKAFIETFDKK
ncbi:MAG: ribonuclease D [Alphaproteobacteria bacterium]